MSHATPATPVAKSNTHMQADGVLASFGLHTVQRATRGSATCRRARHATRGGGQPEEPGEPGDRGPLLPSPPSCGVCLRCVFVLRVLRARGATQRVVSQGGLNHPRPIGTRYELHRILAIARQQSANYMSPLHDSYRDSTALDESKSDVRTTGAKGHGVVNRDGAKPQSPISQGKRAKIAMSEQQAVSRKQMRACSNSHEWTASGPLIGTTIRAHAYDRVGNT